MAKSTEEIWCADFETTKKDCRVWAWAACNVNDTARMEYGHSIESFMEWCANGDNKKIYFHNLRFDGEFVNSFLLSNSYKFCTDKKFCTSKSFTTLIGENGNWYAIDIYFARGGRHVRKVEILDSMKIINFSVEKIAEDFHLPMQKLSMDYDKDRPVGYEMDEAEKAYITNDVRIVATALQGIFEAGFEGMTIGSSAMRYYRKLHPEMDRLFPNLPPEVDEDLRQAYRGGFTYVNEKYLDVELGEGMTFDVNSMYSSIMRDKPQPYGQPLYFEGQYEDDAAFPLYIQQISCAFDLKEGKIPCVQSCHLMGHADKAYLDSSKGEIYAMTMTNVDLKLFLENYVVYDLKYIGGWKFRAATDMFTDYIDIFARKKKQAKKKHDYIRYYMAKQYLNSFVGKFATRPQGRRKIPYLDEDGIVQYKIGELRRIKTLYAPVTIFTNSYARDKVIRTAEKIREFGLKKHGYDTFVYSDTDSISCLLPATDLNELRKIIHISAYDLGAWKLETVFKSAKYLRGKCYYLERQDNTLDVKVSGLPATLSAQIKKEDFHRGFKVETLETADKKLSRVRVKGGVILVDTEYTLK